jgi:hypothetical protein
VTTSTGVILVVAKGPAEPARRPSVAPFGDVDVDHLPELVDRPVDVPPLPAGLDMGFVDEPTVADRMPTPPRGVGHRSDRMSARLRGRIRVARHCPHSCRDGQPAFR